MPVIKDIVKKSEKKNEENNDHKKEENTQFNEENIGLNKSNASHSSLIKDIQEEESELK